MKTEEGISAKQVLDEERKLIDLARRQRLGEHAAGLQSPAVGLALSGGGIRSAAFHVGILQAFATKNRLREIDYVSAVSGGGFAASWLCTQILRKSFASAESDLSVVIGKPPADTMKVLRSKAGSYLTPRLGLLTPEVGLLITTYLHSLLLNLFSVFLLICLVLCLPRIALLVLKTTQYWLIGASILGGMLAFGSVFVVLLRLVENRLEPHIFALKRSDWPWVALMTFTAGWSLSFDLGLTRAPQYILLIPIIAVLALLVPHQPRLSDIFGQKRADILSGVFIVIVALWLLDASGLYPAWRSSLTLGVCWSRIVFTVWSRLDRDADYARRMTVAIPSIVSGFFILSWLFFNTHIYGGRQFHTNFPHLEGYLNSLSRGQSVAAVVAGTVISIILSGLWVYVVLPTRIAKHPIPKFLGHVGAVIGVVLLGAIVLYRAQDLLGIIVDLKSAMTPANSSLGGTNYSPAKLAALGVARAFTPFVSLIAPICIILGTFVVNVGFAIVGRIVSPFKRERITELSSAIYGFTLVWWTFPAVASIWGPVLLGLASRRLMSVAVVLWLATICGGFFGLAHQTNSSKSFERSFRVLAWIAPYALLTGLMFIGSWLLNGPILGVAWNGSYGGYMEHLYGTYHPYLIWLAMSMAWASWFVSTRFGINMSSMHMFYQNRLNKAFLDELPPGGVPKNDSPTSSTPVDLDDTRPTRRFDVTHIEDLIPREAKQRENKELYCGPYLILNACLNRSGTHDLALQERKASNFIFTPQFCGFDSLNAKAGYERSSSFGYGEDPGIRLALAMAISGSALGSNMGRYTSNSRSFLNTIFNVRLGWWLSNPAFPGSWRSSMSRSRLSMFLTELFGAIDDNGPFVNLSDGGHFENLGVYELARRKCGVIVISDASYDPSSTLFSLLTAAERCRMDFGYEIDIDLRSLMDGFNDNSTRESWAVGRIKYSDLEFGEVLYLKAMRLDSFKTPQDVSSYASQNRAFPHESTANQWFTESQFESYRMLGFTLASRFLEIPAEESERGLAKLIAKRRASPGLSRSATAS